MKVMKLFAATLVAFAMFSCQKGDAPEVKDMNVVVNISTPTYGTRAETGSVVTGDKSAISDAYIYVVDVQGNVLKGVPFVNEGAPNNVMTITTTSNATNILVVANYPSDFVPTLYKDGGTSPSKSAIENAVVSMENARMKAGAPASGDTHGATTVMLYNSDAGAITGTGNTRTAAVTIAPVMARIEVAKVDGSVTKGSTASVIESFELAGVFLNNVYPGMKVNGTPNGTKLASEYARTTTDWATDVLIGYTAATDYTPKTTDASVWAYHIAPTTAAADVPQVVLHLKNVTFTAASGLSAMTEAYVVVKSYNNSTTGTSDFTDFKRGFSYKIESLEFNQTNLDVVATPTDMSVTATITVTGWTQNIIVPNI